MEVTSGLWEKEKKMKIKQLGSHWTEWITLEFINTKVSRIYVPEIEVKGSLSRRETFKLHGTEKE